MIDLYLSSVINFREIDSNYFINESITKPTPIEELRLMSSILEQTLQLSKSKGYITEEEIIPITNEINRIASKYQIPADWIALKALTEAEGFNPRAGARSGCIGVMQICLRERGARSSVQENGGFREVGGTWQGYLNSSVVKQLDIWERYHLGYWLKQSKRKPQNLGEFYLINIYPAYFLMVASGKLGQDDNIPFGKQASFLYEDFDVNKGRRKGTSNKATVRSLERGLLWKARSLLGQQSNIDSNVPPSTNQEQLPGDYPTNTTSNASANTVSNSVVKSVVLSGDNCPPPPYTIQDRIIYTGCQNKTKAVVPTSGLSLGFAAPASAATTPNPTQNVAVGNIPPYEGKLNPGGLVNPMKKGSYTLTSGWGWRWGKMHQGVDLAGPTGTPIYAAGNGKVVNSALYGVRGFGSWVRIDHGGLITTYGHVHDIYVKVGQEVKQGELIATVGSRGFSTGPHLHFQIEPGGKPVNPAKYLKF